MGHHRIRRIRALRQTPFQAMTAGEHAEAIDWMPAVDPARPAVAVAARRPAPDALDLATAHRQPTAMALGIATVQRLQQTHGNQFVARLMAQPASSEGLARWPIQRHAIEQDDRLAAFAQTAADAVTEARASAKAEADEETAAPGGRLQRTIIDQPAAVQREVGIAKGKSRKRYVKGVAQDIGATTPRDQLVKILNDRVNTELAAHKVPPTPVVSGDLEPGTRGSFVPLNWRITISQSYLPSMVPQSIADELAGSAYHEARHAEQWFGMVRHVIATAGLTNPYSINQRMASQVKPEIVQAALAMKQPRLDKKEKRNLIEQSYQTQFQPRSASTTDAMTNPTFIAIMKDLNDSAALLVKFERQHQALDAPTSSLPLSTEDWPTAEAGAAQQAWTNCVQQLVQLFTPSGMGAEAQADPAAMLTPAMAKLEPRTQPIRETYLAAYRAQLMQVATSANEFRKQAFARYRGMAHEADAFAVQEQIEQALAKRRK